MTDDSLFEELCSQKVLKIGWHLAQHDSRDDFVSDPVGYEDFASHLTERLSYLIEEIRNKRYRPRHLLDIDVPKSGLSVRPGNVLPIQEATILHAIVYLIAPKIDQHLSKQVYSYRLHKDWKKRVKQGNMFQTDEKELPFLRGKTIRQIDPVEPWYIAWPAFDRDRIRAAREEGYTHLTRTDISAYFENIDLRLLEAQLRALVPHEGAIMELLFRILESWTRVTSTGTPIGRGIPQGNQASSFLGNVYLMPLDKSLTAFCKSRDAVWFRYVDDVEIYSKDYRTARDVVFVINKALRGLYLNLQGSKTEIMYGTKLEEILASSEQEALEVAWKALEGIDVLARKNSVKVTRILRNIPILSRFRRGLPESVYQLSKREGQILRRLMTIYGRCGRPQLRATAFALLREPPELRMLEKSLRYLRQLPYSYHQDVLEELLRMLEEDVFPVPFQSAAVLETIRFLHPPDAGNNAAARIAKWALASGREWVVIQKALETITTLPYLDKECFNLAEEYVHHSHPFVRRAGCVLVTRGPVNKVRDLIQTLLYDPDPGLSSLALLWYRHLTDRRYALDELGRFEQGSQNDSALVLRLPRIWLLRCNPEAEVVRRLRRYLLQLQQSSSKKLLWHYDELFELTRWVEGA